MVECVFASTLCKYDLRKGDLFAMYTVNGTGCNENVFLFITDCL